MKGNMEEIEHIKITQTYKGIPLVYTDENSKWFMNNIMFIIFNILILFFF